MKPGRCILPCALAWLVLFFVGGCTLPQWRVFQKKIDPTLAETPPEKVEAQRQAAAFIANESGTVGKEPAKQLATINAVAVPLSSSLGEPKKPATATGQREIIAALHRGIAEEQKRAEQWKEFAKKYAGRPIEDTGINLAGPAGLVGLIGVIGLCVAVPPVGYVLLRMLPILWGFFGRTTQAIQQFIESHPESAKDLQGTLSNKMDEAHKRIVRLRFNRKKT